MSPRHEPATARYNGAMDVSYLLDDLNPAQREAVSAPIGHYLVLAGAGSGKTRVLTHRIGWLLEVERASPWSILAVTFTNKAAGEMRARCDSLIRQGTRGLTIGTFHGIAHRLLRQHWREAKLPETFQILDSDDQQRLIKRVMQTLGIDDSRFPPATSRVVHQQRERRRQTAGCVSGRNQPNDAHARRHLQNVRGSVPAIRRRRFPPNCYCARTNCG